jgi:Family of unknown function (DUF5343)
MPAEYPPFINSYGLVPKVIKKIKEAETPPRFTQDHLATLGFSGGSARPIIPLLKRIGFLASDGTPTELYKALRNPAQSGKAMATAIRHGYKTIYALNEKAHTLTRQELEGLVVQSTGLDAGATTVRAISATFENLKALADFDAAATVDPAAALATRQAAETPPPLPGAEHGASRHSSLGMNLSYTINLNLPETDNIAVFNAIFQSLRENLLRK